ncbi:hypothetical protein BUZ15_10580 [Staphylococcus gallinarum]|uniref:hypothetical protein n=1 Tax=Staphylococcus gallinarum TaxID=1293 RepID=UPI000D1CA258|nr:hypothetical protein [Staphylococcus gallinarum]PTE79281.1 hypothetical protein BUY96_02335 [Staphylococcus gallinarum]PTK92426.1 hypothetical protein BUZ03_02630 [Staphylococcus gallinarum]PTL09376.1 hypothetical protein BUZ15_10580 [Staphylococcus gallinarum]RIL23717.1 hypothetical protein BUY97_08735 [Staphylococcus gallinarum]RIL24711.1 hypothetical protein BUY99_01415 [Staphylococcus gallinarum]
MKMETITVRYDATFERQVEIPVYDHNENRDLTEYIEHDMENHKNDYLDGKFIEFDKLKIMDWRYS